MSVSRDLQWMVIRKNSCFLHRQRNIQKFFSKERMNLKSVNSFRYNGLIADRAVGIEAASDGNGIVMTVKTVGKKSYNKPGKSTQTFLLKKGQRPTLATIDKTMKRYKPAHSKLAQRRASQLLRGQQPKSAAAIRRTTAKANKAKKD